MASHDAHPNGGQPQTMKDLWKEAGTDKTFSFQTKMDTVAVALVRAIHDNNLSKAQVANEIGVSAEELSNMLSSGANLTLRAVHDIASAVGMEFDIVFRKAED